MIVENQSRIGEVRQPEVARPPERERETTAEFFAGGASLEALTGIAAVVLSIIGLAHLFPQFMAAISAIALGVGLLAEGGAIAARLHRVMVNTGMSSAQASELGGGAGVEFLGGVGAIVLGILALLNLVPQILLPVAVIAVGGALLLGTGATSRLNAISSGAYGTHETARWVAREAVYGAAGGQVLIGAGVIVLGILALLGFDWMLLSLVGFLAAGAAALITGGALAGRMFTMLYR